MITKADIQRWIDQRIDQRLAMTAPAPLERMRGTVVSVQSDIRRVMVTLDGGESQVPAIYPALPVTPVAGDDVFILRTRDGLLGVSHVLGRDGETGGGGVSQTDIDTSIAAHAALTDPHAGYVLESLVDAKGDLLVGTAADAIARLAPPGADDRILVTDAAEAAGMKWQKLYKGGSLAWGQTATLTADGTDRGMEGMFDVTLPSWYHAPTNGRIVGITARASGTTAGASITFKVGNAVTKYGELTVTAGNNNGYIYIPLSDSGAAFVAGDGLQMYYNASASFTSTNLNWVVVADYILELT